MLELFHLLHNVDCVHTLDVDQTECGNINAIVLEVLEIKCLDVLKWEKVCLLSVIVWSLSCSGVPVLPRSGWNKALICFGKLCNWRTCSRRVWLIFQTSRYKAHESLEIRFNSFGLFLYGIYTDELSYGFEFSNLGLVYGRVVPGIRLCEAPLNLNLYS